jgi:hypothetical protein
MESLRTQPRFDPLQPGAPLRIEDGPFRGVRATLLGVLHEGILVAVRLANGLVAVELDACDVRFDSDGIPVSLSAH